MSKHQIIHRPLETMWARCTSRACVMRDEWTLSRAKGRTLCCSVALSKCWSLCSSGKLKPTPHQFGYLKNRALHKQRFRQSLCTAIRRTNPLKSKVWLDQSYKSERAAEAFMKIPLHPRDWLPSLPEQIPISLINLDSTGRSTLPHHHSRLSNHGGGPLRKSSVIKKAIKHINESIMTHCCHRLLWFQIG